MSTYENTRPVDSVRLRWHFEILSSFPNLSHDERSCCWASNPLGTYVTQIRFQNVLVVESRETIAL